MTTTPDPARYDALKAFDDQFAADMAAHREADARLGVPAFPPRGECFIRQHGQKCHEPAVLITPIERTRDGVTARTLEMPVCEEHNRFHYFDNVVAFGERFDWNTDPRVLRYDADETLARLLAAIDNMDCSAPPRNTTRCRA